MHNIANLGRYLGLVEIAIRDRVRDDRGEGVISMAIAVLIVATLGVGLWTFFDGATTGLEGNISGQLNQVGGGGGGTP